MRVLGHRGEILPDISSSYENSIGSIKKGIEFADGIECDVCKTKDEKLVVIHEAKCVYDKVEYCLADNLDTDSAVKLGDRYLEEVHSDELKSFRLKNGENIPFLTDVLDLFNNRPDKLINIELKGGNIANLVLQEVEHRINSGLMVVSQFLISSFDHFAVNYIRKHQNLGLKLGLLFLREDQPERTLMHPWLNNCKGEYLNFSIKNLSSEIAKSVNPDVIIIPEPTLQEQNIKIINKVFPSSTVATWIFSEIQNDESSDIDRKILSLKNSGVLEAVIVDDPEKTAVKLKKLVA